ncbi:MAG: cyclic pyranopterin monophosphate synthase MoaC [Bacillota bacterium]
MEPRTREKALSHLDESGKARMVDVTGKPDTAREAQARCRVTMSPETLALVERGEGPKGEVFGVARVAAVMAAKNTSSLIPMCHSIPVTGVDVAFWTDAAGGTVDIQVTVKTFGKTGAEMEALCGACVAALTIYDMCKAQDRSMVIGDLRLVRKSGGKSGEFVREGEAPWKA